MRTSLPILALAATFAAAACDDAATTPTEDDLLNLKKAYRLLYRSGMNVTQALERIAADCRLDAHIEDLMAFIRRSDRGIVR